jgi:hypothetical protein
MKINTLADAVKFTTGWWEMDCWDISQELIERLMLNEGLTREELLDRMRDECDLYISDDPKGNGSIMSYKVA